MSTTNLYLHPTQRSNALEILSERDFVFNIHTLTSLQFNLPSKRWLFINLSKKELTDVQKSVLSKGPQFAIAPKINAVDIAAPIEAAFQFSTAPPQAVETACVKICGAIARAKRLEKNITKEERDTIRKLCGD